MAIKSTIILIAVTLASSSAQILSKNCLQNMISPGNQENFIKLLRSAAANRCPKPARAVYDLPGNARIIPSEYPIRTLAREPRIINDGCARIVAPVVRERDPNLVDSLVIPKEIFQSLAVATAKAPAKPCQPPAVYNPYLPVASPVSAAAPLNMPPPIQSRGHFLRKIPIPPPCL